MKNLKTLYRKQKLSLFYSFIATISLSLTSCAQTLGIADNGVYKITADITEIKKEWKGILTNQKLNPEISNFEIKSDKMESSGKVYYYLLATNQEKTIKMTRQLLLNNNNFTFVQKRATGENTDTLTCTGCSDGCDPKLKDDGNWKCTSCIEGSGCTKSVTTGVPVLINH